LKENSYNKSSLYIVTKPLQFINALNIVDGNKKTLVILNAFYEANIFFEKISTDCDYFDDFYFFENISDLFKWLVNRKNQYSSLFLDSDFNFKDDYKSIKELNISVYEEGVGTYKRSQYKPTKWFLGNIYLLFMFLRGYKNRRGGNKYTNNIIVYYPDFYKKHVKNNKKNIQGFRESFLKHINNNKYLKFFKSDLKKFNGKSIAIYLTSWQFNENAIKILNKINCDINILKPHPHIKDDLTKHNFDLIINGQIPAEILINDLEKIAKKIVIVSEHSSATVYFSNQKKIEIINISPLSFSPNANYTSYINAYEGLTNYLKK
jgi:hypothetical protein